MAILRMLELMVGLTTIENPSEKDRVSIPTKFLKAPEENLILMLYGIKYEEVMT